jgi:hypothetical protein
MIRDRPQGCWGRAREGAGSTWLELPAHAGSSYECRDSLPQRQGPCYCRTKLPCRPLELFRDLFGVAFLYRWHLRQTDASGTCTVKIIPAASWTTRRHYQPSLANACFHFTYISSESLRAPLKPDLVFPAPFTHRFENWCERYAVGRNRIADVWRNAPFIVSQKYSVRHHFV